jgi:3-oxoacyl-[acyl-carrier-protein] synthase II
MGAITPLGNTVELMWQGLVDGCSAVRTITAFDASALGTRIAAPVQGFDAGKFMDPKEARRLSGFMQFGLAASIQAVDHAGIDFGREDPTRCGVELGSALGGTQLVEEQRLI